MRSTDSPSRGQHQRNALRATLALAALTTSFAGLATTAQAATIDGDASTGCQIRWNAGSIFWAPTDVSKVDPSTGAAGWFTMDTTATDNGDGTSTVAVHVLAKAKYAVDSPQLNISLASGTWTLTSTGTVTPTWDPINPTFTTIPDMPVGSTLDLTYRATDVPSDEANETMSAMLSGTTPFSGGGCRIASVTPTQTAVSGANNDTVAAKLNHAHLYTTGFNPATSVPDTGWVNGRREVLYQADTHYSFRDASGQEHQIMRVTYTDNGSTATPVYAMRPSKNPADCTNTSTTYQVDTYLPVHKAGTWLHGHKLTKDVALTATERATLARLDDDNQLTWREDRAMWGASSVRFVTLNAKDVAASGSVAAALKTRTGLTVSTNLTTVAAGQTVTKAWALAPGATVSAPWGPTHALFQRDADVAAPAAPVCKLVRTQVGTTPATAPAPTTAIFDDANRT